MDGTENGRRYEAGDTLKLEIMLRHRANLKEVRAIFTHKHDKTVPPLIARGQPSAISERGTDGSINSRVDAKVTLLPAAVPGIYKLIRISYETAGGQLGHLEKEKGLPGATRITFEVVGEPADTPSVVDIAIADS